MTGRRRRLTVALSTLVAIASGGAAGALTYWPRHAAETTNTSTPTVAVLSFLLIGQSTSLWVVRLALFIAGFSNSATSLAIQTSMFTTISTADTGGASSMFSVARQSSQAMSVAVLTFVVSVVRSSDGKPSIEKPALAAFSVRE